MAFIKSALELAMEKTEGIKGNPRELKRKEMEKKGRKAASDYLFSSEKTQEELQEVIKAVPKPDKATFKEGVKKALLLNITLPKTQDFEESVNRITAGLKSLTKNTKQIDMFMDQLQSFFQQYIDNKNQLLEAVKQQYSPRLRQKEQEIAQRTGQEIHLTPEQDPEFMDFLKTNITKLDKQFSESLSQVKKELEEYLI